MVESMLIRQQAGKKVPRKALTGAESAALVPQNYSRKIFYASQNVKTLPLSLNNPLVIPHS
jgi:hypothetical protein